MATMHGEHMRYTIVRIGLALVVSAGLCSCATMKGWFGRSEHPQPVVAEDPVAGDEKAQCEAALRELVRESITAMEKGKEEAQNRVIRRSPYFYKEYAVYPDGPDEMRISMQETDSRTRPYLASVKMDKVRFCTRLHRKRNEAAADANFLRDTGEETLTYELRNGRWTRVGSVFVAEKSEENINGQWEPLKEEQKRALDEEEQPGWFSRTWNRILGGD